MSDPYETLGVQQDASPEELRRAYYAGAKRLHPDVGGDAKDFAELASAHALLADPARRAEYDATGRTDELPDIGQKAQSMLAQLFATLLQGRTDLENRTVDVLEILRKSLGEGINVGDLKIMKLDGRIHTLKDVESRLASTTEGSSVLGTVLAEQIKGIELQMTDVEQEQEVAELAITMLDGYVYAHEDFEVRSMVEQYGGWVNVT